MLQARPAPYPPTAALYSLRHTMLVPALAVLQEEQEAGHASDAAP